MIHAIVWFSVYSYLFEFALKKKKKIFFKLKKKKHNTHKVKPFYCTC